MTTTEETKEFLGKLMSEVSQQITSGKLNMSNVPEYYFRTLIRDALVFDEGLPRDTANQIATRIKVDLSGLGPSYAPHKEFLDQLAKDSLVVIWHYWETYRAEFGEGPALAFCDNFSVHIK